MLWVLIRIASARQFRQGNSNEHPQHRFYEEISKIITSLWLYPDSTPYVILYTFSIRFLNGISLILVTSLVNMQILLINSINIILRNLESGLVRGRMVDSFFFFAFQVS